MIDQFLHVTQGGNRHRSPRHLVVRRLVGGSWAVIAEAANAESARLIVEALCAKHTVPAVAEAVLRVA